MIDVLEDGTITHCERPVEWELHGHAECYAWVCTKCQVMSDYDCEENNA